MFSVCVYSWNTRSSVECQFLVVKCEIKGFRSVYRLNIVKDQILTQKKMMMMNWICLSADVVFSHAVCHLWDGQRHDGQQQSGTNAFLSESPAGRVWRWMHTISDKLPYDETPNAIHIMQYSAMQHSIIIRFRVNKTFTF